MEGKGVPADAKSSSSAAAASSLVDGPKRSYQLMGSRGGADSDAAAVNDAGSMDTLKKILEAEQRERRNAETNVEMMRAQIDMMRDMMGELKGEMEAMREGLSEGESEREALAAELDFLRGKTVSGATREQCERLEKQSREVLSRIQERRVVLEREEESRGKVDERRLCVVCCETEKSIVLLPCRHMCLCEGCSEHEAMTACPLCRRQIINKFSVFA